MNLSSPTSKKGKLQREALAVIRRHEANGELPTSARFIYYELKQAGVDTGTHAVRRADQDVIDAVKHLRDHGLVPWHWIVDETRSVTAWASAPTLADAVLERLDRLRLDCWDAEAPPVIITESRGVTGALRPTAATYLAPITSTNGMAGGFLHTDVAPLLEAGQRVLYLGDWNPAGSMIEANTRRVLEGEVGGLDWQRLAITPDQAAAADLPPKPGTDNRHRDGLPHLSFECEALGQGNLAALVDAHLATLLPEPLARVREREQDERAALRDLLEGDA